jgi:hypothetical protein
MVESIISYCITLAFCVIVFCIFLCLFAYCRTKRSKTIENVKPEWKLPRPPIFAEETMTFSEVMSKVKNITEDELVDKTSTEAVLYLTLERYIMLMLNVFAFLGMVILVPVYVTTDEGEDMNMMQATTIGNIGTN